MRFLIVVEETETGFSAYSPDLSGCVATGETREEVQRVMTEAIAFHLDGLRKEGLQVPRPRSFSAYVDVPSS